MKLLLDENLSPRLVSRLAELYPGLTHVRDVGLREAEDQGIWDWAKANGYTVITTDADFVAISRKQGFPPKIIHIPRCDFPFRIIEDLLRHPAFWLFGYSQARDFGEYAALAGNLLLEHD